MYVHFLFEVKATYGLHFCMHFFTFNFDTFSIFQNKGGSQCSMQKSIQRIPKWKSIPHAMKDVYPMEPKQKVFPQLENISPMKDVPQWKVFPKWKMFPWPSGRWKIIPLMQKYSQIEKYSQMEDVSPMEMYSQMEDVSPMEMYSPVEAVSYIFQNG